MTQTITSFSGGGVEEEGGWWIVFDAFNLRNYSWKTARTTTVAAEVVKWDII